MACLYDSLLRKTSLKHDFVYTCYSVRRIAGGLMVESNLEYAVAGINRESKWLITEQAKRACNIMIVCFDGLF